MIKEARLDVFLFIIEKIQRFLRARPAASRANFIPNLVSLARRSAQHEHIDKIAELLGEHGAKNTHAKTACKVN